MSGRIRLCSGIRIGYGVIIRQLSEQLTNSSKMWQSLNYVRMRVINHNCSTFTIQIIGE